MVRKTPKHSDFLFRDHPTPMLVLDRATMAVIAVNKAAVKLFKSTQKEFLENTIESLFPDNCKALKKWAKADGNGYAELGLFTPQDYPTLLLQVNGSHIEWENKPSCIFTLTDVAAALKTQSLYNDFHKAIVSSSIVSRADTKGNITFVNENFVKISGYSKKELLGKNHRIINSGYHPKAFWVSMWKTIAAGKPWRAEVKNKAKDGSYYWVDTFIMPFLDEEGKVREYLSIRNDITSRKHHEEEITGLVKLLSDFNFAINNASIVSRADRQGTIIYINDNFTKISGYKVKELIGKNHRIINSGHHPRSFWVEMWKTIAAGKTWRGEVKNKAKDGSFYWVDTFIMPFKDDNGKVHEYLSIRNDITQRKVQEEQLLENAQRFKQLYNQAPTMMHSIDKDGKLVTVSDYWLAVMGYTREEVLGKKSIEFLSEESRRYAVEEVFPLFRKKGHIENIEYQFIKKNGEVLDCLLTAISHYDASGNFLRSLAVITDITERKRAETEIRRLALIAQHTSNAVVITDAPGHIQWVNEGFTRITEYTLDEVKGKKPGSFLQGPETDKATVQKMHDAIARGEGFKLEILNYAKSGRKYWLDIEVMPLYENGTLSGFIAIELDITVLKESLEEIRQSDESLRSLASNIPNGALYQAYYKNGGRGYNFISEGIEKISGYPLSNFLSDPKFIFKVFHPDDVHVIMMSQSDYESLALFDAELRVICKSGEIRWVQLRSKLRKLGDHEFIRDGFIVDITERKQFELENAKTQRLLAVTSHINHMVVHASDTHWVYSEACRIAVEDGGFRMAWAGGIDKRTGDIIPISISGIEDNYLSAIPRISSRDVPEGRGPTGIAARERRTVVNNNFDSNPTLSLWREEALKRNYHSSIALPVIVENEVVAVFTLYSTEVNFFAEAEVQLLEKIVDNIAFAISNIEKEKKRREVEVSLAESEERFRNLIRDLNVGVLLQGLRSEVQLCNQAACEMLGLTEDQLLGKTSLDQDWIILREDGTRFPLSELPVPLVIGKKESVRGIIMSVFRPKLNDWVWLLVDAIPRYDSDGHVINAICTIYDITEIKKVQHMVVESEERFRTLTNEISVGVLLQGVHDEILVSNQAALDLLGLSEDQLLGKSSFDPDWKVIHEDGSPFLPDDRPSVAALKTKEKVENVTMGIYHPVKKDWVWVITSAVPMLDRWGEVKQVIVSLTDITEQKSLTRQIIENEAKQRHILSSMISGVMMVDGSGKVSYANEKALEIFSLSKEQLENLNVLDHTLPWIKIDLEGNEIPRHEYPVIRAITQRQAVSGVTYGIKKPHEKIRWVLESVSPLIDSDNSFKGALVSFQEISERIESQKQVEEQRKLIDVVSAIQAKFIEERNPSVYFDFALNSILALTNTEYGFIGEILDDHGNPYLKTHAITNIAWSDETRRFYEEHAPKGMEFRNLKSLFGEVMTTRKPVISNNPYTDPRRTGLPHGHPALNAFLGVPIMHGKEMVGMVGIANAPEGFSEKHVKTLEPIIHTLGGIIQALRAEMITRTISGKLQETTDRLNLAIDASGLGVWQGDFIRKVFIGNERIKDIYGITASVIPMDEFWQLIHPEDRERKRDHDLRKFSSEDNEFESEYRIVRPNDGGIRYIKAQGIFFKDNNGKIISGVSVVQDQTKDRQYEASLLNSLEEKEMLIKEIHHRVKNNLQLISSMLYLKMLAWENPDAKEFMAEMREKIKSVSLIHERLLQTESLNTIDIQEYLQKLLYDIQVTYYRQDLRLNIHSDIEKINFSSDYATYLGQLVNELLINAMKHAFVNRKEGEIRIRLYAHDNTYTLQVKDNGVGLPVTADPSKPKSYGMQLVQIFVKQLKGTLQVSREQGTCFTVNFNV